MRDLSEMMDKRSAEPAANQRADSDGQKRKAHVRALLARRRKAGNIFVVARLLDDLAQRQNKQREDRSPDRRPEGEDQPRSGRDHRAQNHGLKRRNLARQIIHQQGERDHGQSVGHENDLDVSVGIDVSVNVSGQADVLLPEHHPVAGEKHQEPHEAADAGEHQQQKSRPKSTRVR